MIMKHNIHILELYLNKIYQNKSNKENLYQIYNNFLDDI